MRQSTSGVRNDTSLEQLAPINVPFFTEMLDSACSPLSSSELALLITVLLIFYALYYYTLGRPPAICTCCATRDRFEWPLHVARMRHNDQQKSCQYCMFWLWKLLMRVEIVSFSISILILFVFSPS